MYQVPTKTPTRKRASHAVAESDPNKAFFQHNKNNGNFSPVFFFRSPWALHNDIMIYIACRLPKSRHDENDEERENERT